MSLYFLSNRYQSLNSYHAYIAGERMDARATILNKVLPHAKPVHMPCLCGSKNEDMILTSIDRWGLPCCEVLCGECGMLRVSPRWDDKTYDLLYAQYFWPLQSGSREISKERFELSVKRAGPYVDYLLNHFDFKDKRVLELGCSYGAGLVQLRNKGATLVGYDWDNHILELGSKFSGLDLRYGGAEKAIEQSKEGYDLVILRHVFEHVLDPFSEARRLGELIRQKGFLFIEIPGVLNPDEWSPDPMAFFNAFHVYSYSLRTLSCVMERCGLELVHGDEHIYSLWRKANISREPPWGGRIEAVNILNFVKRMERNRKWRQSLPGQLMCKALAATRFR